MRPFSLLIILLVLTTPLSAQHALQLESWRPMDEVGPGKSPSFAFSVGVDAGVLFGMIGEYVFVDRDGDGTQDDRLSRLDWEINPLFYMGVTSSIMPLPKVFIGLGAWLGIPGPLGHMEDRDWNEITGDYEKYSISKNNLLNALFTDINIGYSIISDESFVLNAMFGFTMRQYHMAGYDAWHEDPVGSPPVFLSGKVIDFETNFFTLYFAVETVWRPYYWFSLDVFAAICYFPTFVYDRDIHIGPPLRYYQDTPDGGLTLSTVISACFHLGSDVSLRIKPHITWSPPFRGRAYNGGYPSSIASSGASLILGGFSVSLTYAMSFTSERPAKKSESSDFPTLPR